MCVLQVMEQKFSVGIIKTVGDMSSTLGCTTDNHVVVLDVSFFSIKEVGLD